MVMATIVIIPKKSFQRYNKNNIGHLSLRYSKICKALDFYVQMCDSAFIGLNIYMCQIEYLKSLKFIRDICAKYCEHEDLFR